MNTLLEATSNYPLHLLGWKSFQDLAVAVAEECLRRPVQTFLPTKDAGRDGAFIGRWEGEDPAAGESTIQCKFTSSISENLTLSLLTGELAKAKTLAARGLATDYIILTNHAVTGASELQIKAAFEAVGVRRCRVFARDWIIRQMKTSPRLRMMAPRLYGLGDLSELLDQRAYAQAQLILSSMGNDVQRLVVTDAHRRSVRAISEHNLVLLLGAPAAGKSTIGASLAIGAADIWQSGTIKATSPGDIQKHLDPQVPQFFWIDDAWGNTQYQRQTAESWNQIFPLMQGAIQRGTRFLITSRDYIWNAAQRDLKLQSIPSLRKSQVIINVHELTTQERAQILYNHLKLGDQAAAFRGMVKQYLPELAESRAFLPETARRLGTRFFFNRKKATRDELVAFFEKPQDFLFDTISNLSDACRGAIATVFLNGASVRSPVSSKDIEPAAVAFGVSDADIRLELEALNGSLLLLAQDDVGSYWTYKHPTISDAFSRYVAASPEKIEIYLRGATPTSLLYEVVCAGTTIGGAPVVVPNNLHPLLFDRIRDLSLSSLRIFLSYRANKEFARHALERRPELLEIDDFYAPVSEDADSSFIARIQSLGLLPEELRLRFVDSVRRAAIEDADSSVFDGDTLEALLTEGEKSEILGAVRTDVLGEIAQRVRRRRGEWSPDYRPDDYFSDFESAMDRFIDRALDDEERLAARANLRREIATAVSRLDEDYEPPSSTAAPIGQSQSANAGLTNVFRDVDE